MKRLLWLMLAVQAVAFAIGVIVLSEPTTPGSASALQSVGTLTDKVIAALGLGATIVAALSVAPDGANRWFGLAVDAAALLIAWLLLQASPFVLSVTLAAVVLVTFALIVVSLVRQQPSGDADELFEREAHGDAP